MKLEQRGRHIYKRSSFSGFDGASHCELVTLGPLFNHRVEVGRERSARSAGGQKVPDSLMSTIGLSHQIVPRDQSLQENALQLPAVIKVTSQATDVVPEGGRQFLDRAIFVVTDLRDLACWQKIAG